MIRKLYKLSRHYRRKAVWVMRGRETDHVAMFGRDYYNGIARYCEDRMLALRR